MWQLELLLSSGTVCLSIYSLVAAIFGMNIPYTWKEGHGYMFKWVCLVWSPQYMPEESYYICQENLTYGIFCSLFLLRHWLLHKCVENFSHEKMVLNSGGHVRRNSLRFDFHVNNFVREAQGSCWVLRCGIESVWGYSGYSFRWLWRPYGEWSIRIKPERGFLTNYHVGSTWLWFRWTTACYIIINLSCVVDKMVHEGSSYCNLSLFGRKSNINYHYVGIYYLWK